MHIVEIVLHNYRGYKHTVIPITAGLNVIYGEGDAGKSALEKALRWCLLDERQKRFARNNILTKGGKIKSNEEVYVQVTFDTGDIIRRGADSTTPNLYWIGHIDKPYEEWGAPIKNFKEVPDEVKQTINLSDVNVDKQFDSHFLLSQKGSEIAKDLNKMVNLEIIDTSLSNAKHFVTKVKKAKENTEFNLATYEKDLESYSYLEEMGQAITEVEQMVEALAEKKEAMKEVGLLLNTLDEADESRQKCNQIMAFQKPVEELYELISKMDTLYNKCEEVDSMLSKLQQNQYLKEDLVHITSFKDTIQNIEEQDRQLRSLREQVANVESLLKQAYPDTSKQRTIVKYKKGVLELIERAEKIEVINYKYDEVAKLLDTIESNDILIAQKEKEVAELRKGLTGVCPTCGQSLENCKEVV